jgi:hypothetical protein
LTHIKVAKAKEEGDTKDGKKGKMASTNLDAPAGVVRPVVFFDIQIGETPAGRIKMGK